MKYAGNSHVARLVAISEFDEEYQWSGTADLSRAFLLAVRLAVRTRDLPAWIRGMPAAGGLSAALGMVHDAGTRQPCRQRQL
jgi:hypothetical protein